jgi:hypothetical protein
LDQDKEPRASGLQQGQGLAPGHRYKKMTIVGD